MTRETKSGFLFKNLLIGLVWFAAIITVFILTEDYLKERFHLYIGALQENHLAFFGLFALSEICFGLIPPELFMMISMLHNISATGFIVNLVTYSVISYVAGVIGYSFGRSFSKTKVYERIREKYLTGHEARLGRFGGFLVFVGAVTPIPFSATCMLAGSIKLPLKQFLLISATRLIRFGAYGWMVWKFPQWF